MESLKSLEDAGFRVAESVGKDRLAESMSQRAELLRRTGEFPTEIRYVKSNNFEENKGDKNIYFLLVRK